MPQRILLLTDDYLPHQGGSRVYCHNLFRHLEGVDRTVLTRAAEGLRNWDRPALVVWAAEDRVMPPRHGRALADLLPQGRLVELHDSYTLIPLDQPRALAREIAGFLP